MEKKDGNCDDDLKIVNRRREYTVSKKFICSVVPYFEKMFNSDSLDSTKTKVELDFDEHVFNSILGWIHSESFMLQMDSVISFYEVAASLMLNERLFGPCLSYFHENFTIKHLPVILAQVKKDSKLISSGSIDSIICSHFLMIVNTDIFLKYPFQTVETILRLDLMIYSEYQVFESIMKWVNKKVDCRKRYLPKLLNCIRWCFMDLDDLAKVEDHELIKALPDFDEITSSNGDYEFNRSKQNLFVSIQRKDETKLRINMFDNELFCFPIGDFIQDDSMSLEFVHGEFVSDILFDSGTKGIRIDWIKKTFRWLDFKVAGKTYYSQFLKFIVKLPNKPKATDCFLEDKDTKLPQSVYVLQDRVILRSDNKFIVIGKTVDEVKWFGLFPVAHKSWFNNYRDHEHSFHATVLDKVVYILTQDIEFIQFNYETKSFNKSKPFKDEKWNFNDLILASHQTNDEKVILVNKSSGKVYVFCINQKKWIEKYRIMYVNLGSNSPNAPVDELIAFTSTFLPMKVVKPLYKHTLI